MTVRASVAVLAAAVLGGCSSITGFSSEYNCAIQPDGICASLSTAYDMANRGALPGQKAAAAPAAPVATAAPAAEATAGQGQISPAQMHTPSSGAPLRIQPTVLRVWVAPWEDDLGALRDQSYAYLSIDPGRWVVETNRAAIRNQFRAVYPLQRQEGEAPARDGRPQAMPPAAAAAPSNGPPPAPRPAQPGQER